jgi:pimeloyl-ACP methyl ester carboxylesterase
MEEEMLEPWRIGDLTLTVDRPAGPTRPPILFVHGMFGGAWYFERYQTFFAARGYPAYAVNLRGHHGSRPVADLGRVSVLDYVADATEAALRIGAPIVVGHSMGGLITQKLAEAGVARAAVLLCAAPPRGIPVTSLRLIGRQLKYLPALLRWQPVRGASADHDALTLNRVPEQERAALHDRFVLESGRAALEMSLGRIAVDASRVTCPVLCVTASDDRLVAPRIARRIAARYGAPLMQFPGHAHFIVGEPDWEGPATEIEAWLARSVPSAAPEPNAPRAALRPISAAGAPREAS